MSTPSIHLYDAARPDDDDVFTVVVYSDFIPRVGDNVHYHVDNPSHVWDAEEPGQITGTVERVEIEYRRMNSCTYVLALVYLRDYVTKPPKGWRQGKRD